MAISLKVLAPNKNVYQGEAEEVILSCKSPTSVPRVGWYPTAEGILPSKADTSEPA